MTDSCAVHGNGAGMSSKELEGSISHESEYGSSHADADVTIDIL